MITDCPLCNEETTAASHSLNRVRIPNVSVRRCNTAAATVLQEQQRAPSGLEGSCYTFVAAAEDSRK